MTIGYTGPFGDSNFGDYAMLVNDMYDINCKDAVIFTYDPSLLDNISKMYFADFNVKIQSVEIADKDMDSDIPKEGKKYVVEYNSYPDIPLEMLSETLNYQQIDKAVSSIDVLVVVGGGYFNHVWNAKHRRKKLLSIIVPIIIAQKRSKKIVFMGNTYGPFDDSGELFSNLFAFLTNAYYGVRDNLYSVANMHKIGINDRITLLPDDLYFVNDKLKSACGGISAKNDYIVLELYCSIAELEQNKDILISFVATVRDKYDMDVYFLPLDKKFGGEYQADCIKKFIPDMNVYKFKENGFLPVSEAIQIISGAKFVLCNRYHLFVFAIANNVPAVQILKDVCGDKRYYFCKGYGMLKEIMAGQYFDERDFFELSVLGAINNVKENLSNIIKKQTQLFNEQKVNAETQMKKKRFDYINNAVYDVKEKNYE